MDTLVPRGAAGDQGMVNLIRAGEPGRTRASLAALTGRIPAIDRRLA